MPEQLIDRARRLGHEVFAPLAEQGTAGRVNRPLMKALGDEGLLELVLLGSATELCALREGLAHGCTEAETALALQGLGGHPILRSPLRDEWMPRLASGEAVAAFALSEPDAGSDAAALALRADRDGDGYRLTGTKTWISNAPDADVYAVFARTGEAGPRGVTAFVVPRGQRGPDRRIDRADRTPRGRPPRVRRRPRRARPGDRRGRRRLHASRWRRSTCSARAWARSRSGWRRPRWTRRSRTRPGGRPSASRSPTCRASRTSSRRWRRSVQAARLLVRDAAEQYDAGVRPVRKASAMAKLFATEIAQKAVDVAIQVHGARALEQGHLLEHLYREVRAPRIYEGASEVQREIIARELFKEAAE